MVWHLSVGRAIGLLGLVAAAYPFFGDPIVRMLENANKLWTKRLVIALWVVGFTCLTALEWRSITIQDAHQDEQHKYETCLQEERFNKTIDGLNQNLDTTQHTLSGVTEAVSGIDTNINQTKEALNLFMGTDSFPYFDFTDPTFQQGYAKKIGRYPVSDVTVTFYTGGCGNQEGLGACRYVVSMGTKTFAEINDFSPTPPPAAKYSHTQGIGFTLTETHPPIYTMFAYITARNGVWREFMQMAQVKSRDGFPQTERDIRIYETLRDDKGRPNGRNMIWECRTKGMPESALGFDLVDETNIRVYGKPIHVKSPEEGGIAASGIYFKTPVDCD